MGCMKLSHTQHQWSLDLHYHEQTILLGMTPAPRLFVEEVYTEMGVYDWFAQHDIDASGVIQRSVDEAGGKVAAQALTLPEDVIEPDTQALDDDFTGPRQHGLREAERLSEVVRPLSILSKQTLIEHFGLGIPAMMLFGLAEVHTLTRTRLPDASWLVCRRLRLAIALPEPRPHPFDGLPYDYETRLIYGAYHLTDLDADFDPAALLTALDGVPLVRPMGALCVGEWLALVTGGDPDNPERKSQVHLWRMV